jgi:hypothetical protein
MNEIEELKRKVADLESIIRSISNSASIPKNIEDALRTRFRIDEFTPMTTSSKSVTSENQSVNEAGVASYDVMKKPDGFLQIVIGASTYYLPYFS